MKKIQLSPNLQVVNLKVASIDLSQIGNRRFMYHPTGLLILGEEDHLHPGKGLYSSHAEEYHLATSQLIQSLPSFDAFCRGWIGNSKEYPHGIIHFAPGIQANYLPHFNAAFDFLEVSQKNGLTNKVVLRNFCDQWEQKLEDLLCETQPPLDIKIQAAGEGRGPSRKKISPFIER